MRVFARILDFILVFAFAVAVQRVTNGLTITSGLLLTKGVTFVGVVVAFVYEASFLMFCGATPGKWVLDISVVDRSGHRLIPRRAAIRAAVWNVAPLFPCVGGLVLLTPALFRRRPRGLHDQLAGTLVVEGARRSRRPMLLLSIGWIVAMATVSTVQSSMPGVSGSEMDGVTSMLTSSSTGQTLGSAGYKANGPTMVFKVRIAENGRLRLKVTDVTLPPGSPFVLDGVDSSNDGAADWCAFHLRARACGPTPPLRSVVLHTRLLGVIALHHNETLTSPILPPDC